MARRLTGQFGREKGAIDFRMLTSLQQHLSMLISPRISLSSWQLLDVPLSTRRIPLAVQAWAACEHLRYGMQRTGDAASFRRLHPLQLPQCPQRLVPFVLIEVLAKVSKILETASAKLPYRISEAQTVSSTRSCWATRTSLAGGA